MKGTAVILKNDQTVTYLEDVDHSLYREMKQQEACAQSTCIIHMKEGKFDNVVAVLWYANHVDWDYGY